MASITTDLDAKLVLEMLIGHIQNRANAPEYAGARALVADFLEKFVVPELVHAETSGETFPLKVEISDTILDELRRGPGVAPDPAPVQAVPASLPEMATDPDVGSVPVAPVVQAPAPAAAPAKPKPRNGNGHKADKSRPMTKDEKARIRAAFAAANGEVAEDTCLGFHKTCVGADITVFQVNGYVSWCHKWVADGSLEIPDHDKYVEFMKTTNQWKLYQKYGTTVPYWKLAGSAGDPKSVASA